MTIYVNIFLNKFEKGPLLTSSLLGQILLRPAITYIEISRPYTIQALPQRCNGTQILPLRTSYFRNTPIGTSYYVVPIKPDITRALPWRQCYSHTHWGHILFMLSQRHSVTLTLTEATLLTPSQRHSVTLTLRPHITHTLSETQCYSNTHWGHILLTPSQRHSVILTLTEATYYSRPLRDTALPSHSLRPHITHALSETQRYPHTHWGHILLTPSQRHSVTLTLTEATYYSRLLRDTVLL